MEKPIGLSVAEGERMLELVQYTKLLTFMSPHLTTGIDNIN
jgi:predicted dehydrogenase